MLQSGDDTSKPELPTSNGWQKVKFYLKYQLNALNGIKQECYKIEVDIRWMYGHVKTEPRLDSWNSEFQHIVLSEYIDIFL